MTAFAGLLRSRVTRRSANRHSLRSLPVEWQSKIYLCTRCTQFRGRHAKIWGWRDDVKKMSENWHP